MLINELSPLCELQSLLCDLTTETVPKVADAIKGMTYFYSKEKSYFIANEIKMAAASRTLRMRPYAQLIKVLIAEFPEFKEVMFQNLIFLFPPDHVSNHHMVNAFIRCCIREKIFDIKQILSFIDLLFEKNCRMHLSEFLVSFITEVNQYNPKLIPKFLEYRDPWAMTFSAISSAFKVKSKEELQSYVDKGYYPGTAEAAIIEDNIEALIMLAKDKNFNLFDGGYKSQMSVYNNDVPNFSLLNMAAYLGSIKCFKFIYQFVVKQKPDGLLASACAGGNFEIIHLAEERDKDYIQSLYYAAKFKHVNVFMWLLERSGKLDLKIIWNLLALGGTYNIYFIATSFSKYCTAADFSEFSNMPTWRSAILHGNEAFALLIISEKPGLLKYMYHSLTPFAKSLVRKYFKQLKNK